MDDRTVVITGGAGGLGTAVVERVLRTGANVVVPCFNEAELEQFELRKRDHVFAKSGIDLTDEDQAQEFFDWAIEQGGPLWASVHIAGGFGMGPIEDAGKDMLMKQLNLNTITCYNSCRAAIQRMRNNDLDGGRIVNIAARPALEPRQGKNMAAYTASKAAVAAMTEALAEEVVEDDILINAVAPSTIDTEANRQGMPDADFSKWVKPAHIAEHINYLISPDNKVSRGGIIPVYGKA
jgi:NAD(P)-dependent dehydrogenase (short-subunit alcohol dehydrogenase family)